MSGERSLDKQVRMLIDNLEATEESMHAALKVIRELIDENRQIRKLAGLPARKYPKELRIRNTTWPL